ncbi:MAG TPA: hypothetical protein PLA65_11650 [Spirochaetota bacterium]|nr:hypothetical protein [Spirochaetota bacterium]HOD15568.1 hypothetical protein [Spirochaetota bacterium]HPG49139.1 hypothetical protein [Spirochaetota bacterium]HPN12709.1 hypothetical protein [Spirochaetota bacterium]
MNEEDLNIYRVDDIFIKVGYICLVFMVLIGGTMISAMARGKPLVNSKSMYLGAAMFGVPAVLFLAIGYAVRRREKTAATIWRKLETASEVAARDLMAGSGLSRGRVERALLTINSRGRGFYVWDRDTDLIVDVRLRQGMMLVENCDRCGARIGGKFPVTLEQVPVCPYCGNPLNMDRWNDLKRKVIGDIKDRTMIDDRTAAADETSGRKFSFSKPLFVVLLLLFWPAALIYALVRYNNR